ncbi:MAG: phosphoribosylaminoimidazolesuccinocarboxamide synthase, partial [Anaerolineae bacterium]
MEDSQVVLETSLPYPLAARGKVRDIYDLGDRLLMVATDRISAFDVVLPTGIPDKGRILTKLSAFWFRLTEGICPNHLLGGVELLPDDLAEYRGFLDGRAVVVRKARVFPVECVVRGYLSGSAWQEYRSICRSAEGSTVKLWDMELPAGLRESDRLPQPIFTPTTKAITGHDQGITFDEVVELVGKAVAERLKELSLEIYNFAAEYAL